VKEKVKGVLKLLRPVTLVAPMLGGIFFGLMAIRENNIAINAETLSSLFVSCFILAMANATSNIFNQIFDRELDSLHPQKRNRPIPSGQLTLDEGISIGILLMIATLSLAFYKFGVFYGGTLAIILAFSWMYSSPPLRLKKRLVLSNLAIATPRGGLGIITAYSAFGNPLSNWKVLLAGLCFGIYVFGANTFKDYADYEVDKSMGIRNFVTVYGKERASQIVAPFLFIPFIIITFSPLMWLVRILECCIAWPISLIILLILKRDPKLERKLENSILWYLFYTQFSLMIIFYTLPFIL